MIEPKMPIDFWDRYFNDRMYTIEKSIAAKAKEYAEEGEDRMHNFNTAQDVSGGRHKTRESAIFGMMLKHWVSILDILAVLDKGELPDLALVKEKFGDMINYAMLMEGSIRHKIDIKNEEIYQLQIKLQQVEEPVDDLPF